MVVHAHGAYTTSVDASVRVVDGTGSYLVARNGMRAFLEFGLPQYLHASKLEAAAQRLRLHLLLEQSTVWQAKFEATLLKS
jgi:hypothetical protein